MKVLVACEFSGVVREAFISRGHSAVSCDLRVGSGSGPHVVGDVRELLDIEWDLLIAHPPCTALCVTGNRHYAGTKEREDAVEFFRLFLSAPIKRICVENPVGIISSTIRKPDQYIQPYQFGHPVTKKTGLWLKNLPPLVPTNVVEPDEQVVFSSGARMSKWFYETSLLPPGEREAARSITFQGIADAMADQWG
jgi:site-specific DNA-cytosine methylase